MGESLRPGAEKGFWQTSRGFVCFFIFIYVSAETGAGTFEDHSPHFVSGLISFRDRRLIQDLRKLRRLQSSPTSPHPSKPRAPGSGMRVVTTV